MYTLADLEHAKAERRAVEARWDNYGGNNPNKYHSERNAAQAKVEIIEAQLKATGVIPLTEHERIEQELDRLYPDAKSKEIVEHRGVRYERRFSPAERSRRGNVLRWHKAWVAVQ